MNNTTKLIMPTELNEVTPYVIRAVPTKNYSVSQSDAENSRRILPALWRDFLSPTFNMKMEVSLSAMSSSYDTQLRRLFDTLRILSDGWECVIY